MSNKSPDAFRTISEVADWLGVPTHVLRFWESRFSQVKPVKRAGGRRYYRPADMALLGGIRKLLHEDGMTIRGVQKLLREEGVKHVSDLSPPLDEAAMLDVTPANVVSLEAAREEDSTDAAAEVQAIEEAELVASAPEASEPVAPEPENFEPLAAEPEAPDAATAPPAEAEAATETEPQAPAEPPAASETTEPFQTHAPDMQELEATPEGIEMLAHDAEPVTSDWFEEGAETPGTGAPDANAGTTAERPAPAAASPGPETTAEETAAEAPGQSGAASGLADPAPGPQASPEAPTQPPAPPFGDISHIPEDPPEAEDSAPLPGQDGLLATLAKLRKSDTGPQNKVGLTVIYERLTALRARMAQTTAQDPRH